MDLHQRHVDNVEHKRLVFKKDGRVDLFEANTMPEAGQNHNVVEKEEEGYRKRMHFVTFVILVCMLFGG